MITTVHWSEEAKTDYASNILYLLEKWTPKDVQEFVDKADNIIEIITSMPEAFPVSGYMDTRKALVCKQISLYYTINKSKINLVRFWNNMQNPENLVNEHF